MTTQVQKSLLLAALAIFVASYDVRLVARRAPSRESSPGFNSEELKRFAALRPIDAHTHIYFYDPAYIALLNRLNLSTLDIMVVSDNGAPERRDLAKESRDVFEVVHRSGGRVSACTTFDAYRFNAPNFAAGAIGGIDQAFKDGAVAVKLWKNVGMEIKDANGRYILPDDPALTSIYRDIAVHHKTLVMHIADPDTAWLPPGAKAVDMDYYLEHPEWYMYKIAGAPSKGQILNARDHVLDSNPDLKVVGAHLGSMEADFPRISADLDRHPNFAVDLTARMPYLAMLPRDQAITFLTKYQDRIIYGTDDTAYPGSNIKQIVRSEESDYARDWRFLATNESVCFDGIETPGLVLPDRILRKIYHDNAVRWYSIETPK